jgi:hypothetical protein
MSMIANYRHIAPEQLDYLLAHPDEIGDFLYEETGDNPSRNREIDIDKAWHSIHFMLTGDPWGGAPPLANAVLGGTALGDEDVGYGPARYLTSDEVNEVAGALSAIPPTDLARRYKPDALTRADIYPNIWQREGQGALDYLLEYYDQLVGFFQEASGLGHAMLLWMN